VVERRRAVALAHHFREAEGLSVEQIAARLGREPATIRAYFYDLPERRHGRSRRATSGYAEAAASTRSLATARATPARNCKACRAPGLLRCHEERGFA
jgi:hypothetical protein